MPRELTEQELLKELEPVVEANLNRHLALAKTWHPHDYVPWGEGRNFRALGGTDWDPDQSGLDKAAKAAMVTNLLTEDNLPSYHREIAENFSLDRAWGTWVGRWTAEENRHAIVIRDYLVVTRGVDPVALERARMENMTTGFVPATDKGVLHTLAYVTVQELATRVSHHNTGKVCGEPIADRMLQRVAVDENLHMVFYRNLTSAAFDLQPDTMMRALVDVLGSFQMPGTGMPDFRRNAVTIAKAGIYDPRIHVDEVIRPVLQHWRIFERTDFGSEGEHARDDIAARLEDLETKADRFEERRERLLDRAV
ncbi:acyl-ACP desaturase [Speluncibacter jeojiensis]|uniref:Acyl-ACP desaturase n=1 Tax=Speluncibacter jeojiensis TaxID=2710754 RepID=A0A9X4LX21_9ACTN|nr:acyl-ACP desaturase [Corynebacteriales bacterium D3-21]